MIDNDKIFSCESYKSKSERSQEEYDIFEKIKIGFGIILLAWSLFTYVIIPIYRKTPLYKYLLKRKESKEKELAKQRKNEYKEHRKAEDAAFEQIKKSSRVKTITE